MNKNNFNTLDISKDMIENLTSLGFNKMTTIQKDSLPYILDGRDVIAKAKTGSGKTVSFGIGVLNNLDVKKFRIQALILCPTRELASQVAKTLKDLARFQHNIKILSLTGGMPYKPQVHSLSHQAHIIVGTAGRVLKHLKDKNFETNNINTLVLDEADRMLDMGFSDDINEIISYLPKNRQTLLFSATYPETIEELAKNIMVNPEIIEVESTHSDNIINQEFYNTKEFSKDELIPKLFKENHKSIMIFCNTKVACNELADYLDSCDLSTLVLHSDLDQKERDETVVLFANKSYPILIATDVASRGLDIPDIDLVINYDLPHDFEVYTHRIGRTARAGKKGNAITFIDDEMRFMELQEYLGKNLKLLEIKDIESSYLKLYSEYSTLFINGGKRDKLRAGDILGALTAGLGLDKNDIGKIDILYSCSYVAVKNSVYENAYNGLNEKRIKNRYFRIHKK